MRNLNFVTRKDSFVIAEFGWFQLKVFNQFAFQFLFLLDLPNIQRLLQQILYVLQFNLVFKQQFRLQKNTWTCVSWFPHEHLKTEQAFSNFLEFCVSLLLNVLDKIYIADRKDFLTYFWNLLTRLNYFLNRWYLCEDIFGKDSSFFCKNRISRLIAVESLVKQDCIAFDRLVWKDWEDWWFLCF